MAAHVLAGAGHRVRVFEKKKGPGRKLLVAGSSGLNVTYDAPPTEFLAHYRGPHEILQPVLAAFGPVDWLKFIERLGIATFKGTSRRYFVKGLKASGLLRAWLFSLHERGVEFSYEHELRDFSATAGGVRVEFTNGVVVDCAAAVLALGGGSWEKTETPLRWPAIFSRKGLRFTPFSASNVGYRVAWPAKFLAQAEGQPLKNITLTTSRGSKRGDLMVTSYGLEGTPVYTLGETAVVYVDLKPDLTEAQILEKISAMKENRSPLRRVKKLLKLAPASLALLETAAPPDDLASLALTAALLKKFPISLLGPQPLEEAISSAGGLAWEEVNAELMLTSIPGVFLAGEMLDWDAPTGGFLIQGCVSLGHWAGSAVLRFLAR